VERQICRAMSGVGYTDRQGSGESTVAHIGHAVAARAGTDAVRKTRNARDVDGTSIEDLLAMRHRAASCLGSSTGYAVPGRIDVESAGAREIEAREILWTAQSESCGQILRGIVERLRGRQGSHERDDFADLSIRRNECRLG